MPRIKWITDEEATGEVADAFATLGTRFGGNVPDPIRLYSLRPDLMKLTAELFLAGHFRPGFLNRRQKEMIATYVSALQNCQY